MSRVYVTELVDDVRSPHRFRWLVTAAYEVNDGQAACVDYRVQLLPADAGVRTLRDVGNAAIDSSRALVADDVEVPGGGLPFVVLQRSSPSRLAGKAVARIKARRARGYDVSRALEQFTGSGRPRPGRPPVMPLGERLRVLQAVETAYANGETLDAVGEQFAMSRSAVRDLLSWARHDADPPLFTSPGPGRRGGNLTPEARAIIEQLGEDQ